MSALLVTDLYEVTMAATYLRHGMTEPATFSLFVRRLPPNRGFLVAAGVDEAVDRLAAWELTRADVDRLVSILRCPAALLEPLVGLPFGGDVWAVPEGRVVLADEPLLEVTAPLPQAQLVETTLLNAVTYQTAVASKAVRAQLAARGRPVIDFALRRTHGIEAGMSAARGSAIAGFAGTSNVAAAIAYGLAATGTMAHSFVQAFPTEDEAFQAFAEAFPAAPTFLVDTYHVGRGVRAAIRVIHAHGLADRAAIRIDSGDLGAQARQARYLLDAAGLPRVRIIVSGGLDEFDVDRLMQAGAPVDVFAVGTKIGVSADAPLLDSAYKLVDYADQPRLKTSPGKAFLPGPKQVWRAPGQPDLLATRDQPGPVGARPLLEPVMRDGRRVRAAATVAEARAICTTDLHWLPAHALATHNVRPAYCVPSPDLLALDKAAREGLPCRHRPLASRG